MAQATQSPRELEATVLLKAAARLQAIRDDWDGRAKELDDALTYNRKIWTVLVSAVTQPDNPLPAEIRQNVANLGLFIFRQTLNIMSRPTPEQLAVLVTINRELAAGLRGRPAPAAP